MSSIVPKGTFDELLSTGRLDVIKDAELRSRLYDYYLNLDLAQQRIDLLPDEYRTFVRSRIPWDLQIIIRENCESLEHLERCSFPLNGFDPKPFLLETSNNLKLAAELNLSRQQIEIVTTNLEVIIEDTDLLIQSLDSYSK